MSSRFYKLTYFINKIQVKSVINLYSISKMECYENVITIFFQSPSNNPQVLKLTFTTEKECEEHYNGIETAMNPVNKTKLA